MLVVTGAAGFIGSCLIGKLNRLGFTNIIAVDEFSRKDKLENLQNKQTSGLIHREQLMSWIENHQAEVEFIFHLGARTDTTEKDQQIFDVLNLQYSKNLWQLCSKYGIKMLYASSAATYGAGQFGYVDDHHIIAQLRPLNPYGISKNDFDVWALQQREQPPQWAGLKFFNVYGPNESHKGRMASVIFHAFHQIKKTGKMKLFKSHRSEIEHGHQSRDFIYVLDIIDICLFCMNKSPANGLYNAGTGIARNFLDLVKATFHALNLEPSIEFIDTPLDIRDTYQYFTKADMAKLHGQGFEHSFVTLEAGVHQYVTDFLRTDCRY